MQLTAVERLILLRLTQVLEIIDPANAKSHDADAQALELGTPTGIVGMFDVLDLDPQPRPAPILRLISPADPLA